MRPHHILRIAIALLCGPSIPRHRHRVVLRHALTLIVNLAKDDLGVDITLLSERADQTQCRGIVAPHMSSDAILERPATAGAAAYRNIKRTASAGAWHSPAAVRSTVAVDLPVASTLALAAKSIGQPNAPFVTSPVRLHAIRWQARPTSPCVTTRPVPSLLRVSARRGRTCAAPG